MWWTEKTVNLDIVFWRFPSVERFISGIHIFQCVLSSSSSSASSSQSRSTRFFIWEEMKQTKDAEEVWKKKRNAYRRLFFHPAKFSRVSWCNMKSSTIAAIDYTVIFFLTWTVQLLSSSSHTGSPCPAHSTPVFFQKFHFEHNRQKINTQKMGRCLLLLSRWKY